MKKEILICSLIVLFILIPTQSISSLESKYRNTTLCENGNIPLNKSNMELRDLGDLQFMWAVGQQTNDYQIMGCECNGTHFFLTGGNSANDPNMVYIFDFEGNFVDSFDQPGTSSWGWYDLAWDGEYFYGGEPYTSRIDVFTDDGTVVDHIPGPVPWCAGLAYDPGNDHLWTIDRWYNKVLYEIDMDGNVVNSYPQPFDIYGLAWDIFSIGSPFLWCAAQEPDCRFYQFDPRTGSYTGVFFDAEYPSGTLNKAAGLGFTTQWNTSAGILFAIQQCDTPYPGNQLAGYTICKVLINDTTPPITSHIFDPLSPDGNNDWYVNNVIMTITATDDISGIAWTKYSLNNGVTWVTHTGPGSFDVVVSDGEHKIKYYSRDNAGNEEPIKGPFVLKVDKVKPYQQFYSDPILIGPFILALINIGFVNDGCSGLDRVDFILNDHFHHKINISNRPVGILCVVTWVYKFPGVGDKCSGIVYDKAGNCQQMKPQTSQIPQSIPQFRNLINTNYEQDI
jgi:hypothetical protein